MTSRRAFAFVAALSLLLPVVATAADPTTNALDSFVGLLPADLDAPNGLTLGSWTLGAPMPQGSVKMYEHSDRAYQLDSKIEGAPVTVWSLDGKIVGIRIAFDVAGLDTDAAHDAIFAKMGKTFEVNKGPTGTISYSYRNQDRSARLYLGTASDQLMMTLDFWEKRQELQKLEHAS